MEAAIAGAQEAGAAGAVRPRVEIRVTGPLAARLALPAYATAGAAGMDLRACIEEAQTIGPGETSLLGSGIAVSIRDPSLMAVLAPRSGLATRSRIVLANQVGIIDSDYQDEVKVALWNAGSEPYTVEPGERICQMLFVPVRQVELEVVGEFGERTARGSEDSGTPAADPAPATRPPSPRGATAPDPGQCRPEPGCGRNRLRPDPCPRCFSARD